MTLGPTTLAIRAITTTVDHEVAAEGATTTITVGTTGTETMTGTVIATATVVMVVIGMMTEGTKFSCLLSYARYFCLLWSLI